MQFYKKTNIDFIKSRFLFFGISVGSLIAGLLMIFIVGINFGIDFVGGTEIQFSFNNNVEITKIREVIEKNPDFEGAEIKSFGKTNQFIVRVKENNSNDSKVSIKIMQALEAGFPNYKISKLGENTIGPKVGKEMRISAAIAVVLSVIAILLYVAFRFEWKYGLGAIIGLVHDVIFTFGFTLFIGKLGLINLQFDQTMLAALLTVIGYSINDTVVIFDRIRENKELHKGMPIKQMINMSLNETLSRTINTGLSVIVVLAIMVFTAGPVLQGFAFTMLIGIIVGTYSSVYVSSSYVIWVTERNNTLKLDKAHTSLAR